jgi:hypothetical protein
MKRFIAFGLFGLLSSLAVASTIRHDEADSLYTSLGAQYPAVCRVFGAGGGSGTLIAPNWVLTAGHVFSGGTTGTVRFGSDVYNIAQVIEYSGWDLGKNDLALVRLATPVVGVTPVRMWNGGGEVGKVATSVGFGSTGTGLTGNTGGWGTKRGFRNVVDGYNEVLWGHNYYGLITDFDKPDGSVNTFGLIGSSATALALEGCGAPGDSGGGLFINYGGEEFLVGVTSYVAWEGVDPWAARPSNLYGYYGDNNGYSSVREAQNWITNNSGVGLVPEPTSMLTLGIGAISVMARKRKTVIRKTA